MPDKTKDTDLIINIDGGSRGNPGPGASGWVIKERGGRLLVRDGVFFKECTNNQAEFNALKNALAKAAELGAREVAVYSDSLLLVKQYSGEFKIKNPELKLIMEDIKRGAKTFKRLTLTHVPREKNKEADAVCNEIMDKALKKKTAAQPANQNRAPAAVPPAQKKAAVQLELFEFKD